MFKPVDLSINFPEMEKKWLMHWAEKGTVKKYLHKNDKSDKYFSFLDGPITANNPMGVHHAWGRTYKDLWPKFFNLLGYKQRFQNGFDCQGLWVEVEVEKELGLKSKKDIENLVPGNKKASIAKFVQLCKDRVIKFSGIQTEQSKRLGYFADWDHSYFTMADENNYMIWKFLKVCHDNGWIYKGHESVPWCPRCETAISQHEMLTEDYKELVHESIYFKLKVQSSKFKVQNEYLLVWTTTPWTIPANIAVAVNETFDYSLSEAQNGKKYWIVKELAQSILGNDFKKLIKTVKGKELVGLKYKGPFDHIEKVKKTAETNPLKFHTVIATDENILPISVTEGTGMVHTAVSAGAEDFKLGKKLGLPMIPVIADNADYLAGLGFLSGKNAKKNPRLILDYLEQNNWAYKIHKYKHRYPACWRCKTELVWKVADEWYIAMDKPSQIKNSKLKIKNLTLRQRMINVAKSIKWMPEFGLDRELDWLKNMHDWLISKKNRYWGLALPIYECKKCGNFDVVGSKEELKEKALKGWEQFDGHSPHKPYIDEVLISCSRCQYSVARIEDVGNPWLDAGIVSFSTIAEKNQGDPLYLKNKKEWQKWFPADFITESFPGQFKNWFYALIAEATVLENTNPFKRVLGFATMLGEDGRPMHKSWGNMIEFNEGAEKIGVDVMRWMFARHNPADNMLFGYKKADEVRRQFYLMLWNIYRFFVEYANLESFKAGHPQGDQNNRNHISHPKGVLDKWILSRFTNLLLFVEVSMKKYNAKDAALEIEKFVSDLSTWYIRRSRDRVWVNSDNDEDKLQFYQNLHYILSNLTIMISTFMPFISEEIYINLIGGKSVHLASWPVSDKSLIDKKLETEMAIARKIVEAGHALRKSEGKKIRVPLRSLSVELKEDIVKISDPVWELVLKELNIKNVVVNKIIKYPSVEIEVSDDDLAKEGSIRESIRNIQSKRKELGLKPTDKVKVVIPENLVSISDEIKKKILASEIVIGDKLEVIKS